MLILRDGSLFQKSFHLNNIEEKMGSEKKFVSIFGVPAYVKTHYAYQTSTFKPAIVISNYGLNTTNRTQMKK
jgi:hypothetical protein